MKASQESRRAAVSKASQTNYQTATVIGAGAAPPATSAPFLFFPAAPGEVNFMDYAPETLDDKGAANGTDFATEQFLISHDNSITRKIRLSSYWAGWINFFLFGQTTTIAGPGGSTNAKKHTSTPIDKRVNQQLPAFTFIEEVVATVYKAFWPSCIIERCTIRGNTLGFLEAEVTLRGSGKRDAGQTVNFEHATAQHVFYPQNLQYFFNSQASLVVTDNGTPINIGCDYLEWEVTVNNNPLLEAGYLPGCAQYQTTGNPTTGAIRSELLLGGREITLRYKAYLTALGAHYYPALLDQRPLVIENIFAGATLAGGTDKHTYQNKAFLTKYSAVKAGFENGLLVVDISPKVLQDASGNVFQSYCINDVASYS